MQKWEIHKPQTHNNARTHSLNHAHTHTRTHTHTQYHQSLTFHKSSARSRKLRSSVRIHNLESKLIRRPLAHPGLRLEGKRKEMGFRTYIFNCTVTSCIPWKRGLDDDDQFKLWRHPSSVIHFDMVLFLVRTRSWKIEKFVNLVNLVHGTTVLGNRLPAIFIWSLPSQQNCFHWQLSFFLSLGLKHH